MNQPTDTEKEQIIRAIFGERQNYHSNSNRFEAYFKHYASIVCPASTGNAVIELDTPALGSHADVLNCVHTIFRNPKISFNEFITEQVYPMSPDAGMLEKKYVVRVVALVSLGINCTLNYDLSEGSIGIGPQYSTWEGDISFDSFVERAFSSISQPSQPLTYRQRYTEMMTRKKSLKAWKLMQRYGIEVKGTNNLLDHLALDPKTKCLKVFHQVSFLRAHLEKTKQESLDFSFEESLRRGTLPPKLLLETLLTFHDVLFPITSIQDTHSLKALKTMVRRRGFDAEGRWIEFIRATPLDMTFDFWGERLLILYNIVRQPPPSNAMVAWLERHTSERNALTVAIIGVFLSVLFGFLSFIVGLLQLILAWVAYRYPADQNS